MPLLHVILLPQTTSEVRHHTEEHEARTVRWKDSAKPQINQSFSVGVFVLKKKQRTNKKKTHEKSFGKVQIDKMFIDFTILKA